MHRLLSTALSLFFIFTLLACSQSESPVSAAHQPPTAQQVLSLIEKANDCPADSFNCKPIDQLKKALSEMTAHSTADFTSYMQATTNPAVKSALIVACSQNPVPAMLPLLVPEMTSADWNLRRNAQKAVMAVGNDAALDALVKLLDQNNDEVRELVPTLLVKKADHPKVKACVSKLKEMGEKATTDTARVNAVNAVAKIAGHDVVKWLMKIALRDKSVPVREAAVRALEPWAAETPVYNCLVDVSRDKKNPMLARLAKTVALRANKR